MKKNKGSYDAQAFEKIFKFIEIQATDRKVTQTTTYYFKKPIYSVLFLNDDISACYLYGSGDVEIKNRYAGSSLYGKQLKYQLIKNYTS